MQALAQKESHDAHDDTRTVEFARSLEGKVVGVSLVLSAVATVLVLLAYFLPR